MNSFFGRFHPVVFWSLSCNKSNVTIPKVLRIYALLLIRAISLWCAYSLKVEVKKPRIRGASDSASTQVRVSIPDILRGFLDFLNVNMCITEVPLVFRTSPCFLLLCILQFCNSAILNNTVKIFWWVISKTHTIFHFDFKPPKHPLIEWEVRAFSEEPCRADLGCGIGPWVALY